ncbi:MAG: preprotein translocase subunit SecA [Christensenellaceae bacterium]|nr:preprotein translocase subunit SecA [Christensenellaceae bacterium]
MGLFDWLFKRNKQKQVNKLDVIAQEVEDLEPKFSLMTDIELKEQTELFRQRFKDGETLDDLLPEAFAVVREAGKRVLNMRHFRVQLIGGIVLHQGRIAEMQTGEGKTLVATLPAYLNALSGGGVHIVTVNDYLAKRDAEWMGKIFNFLGMTVGVILPNMPFDHKKAAYACDITYATNNELGFDYLRDNMANELVRVMQRGQNFAIVDEVDSILIDEARTPLIISAPASESNELYVLSNKFVQTLDKFEAVLDAKGNVDEIANNEENDYILDEKDKHIFLTDKGITKAERFFRISNLGDSENADIASKINSALRANYIMFLDQDYIVEDGEIVIVDEFTGRKMLGRRYSEGLHQAIEAKEQVTVRKENKTIATITFQNLFRLYKKLSGMTGTAITEEAEFNGIYALDVVPVPSNRPNVRRDEADKIYMGKDMKYSAAIADIEACFVKGQPVLVGTTNVEASEYLSTLLRKKGIRHNVLNAKNHTAEARIIAQAGMLSAVTIATNMAGRGTDILLGGNPEFKAREIMATEKFTPEEIEIAVAKNSIYDERLLVARARFNELIADIKTETEAEKVKVIAAGGLRVIGTERHESRRIDNQLRGRAGRQGDPGSSCFYLSFEDDLLRLFGGDRMKGILMALTKDEETEIQSPMLSKQVENAQKRCEENNYQRRRFVLNYDDVMNAQRKLIYSERNEILNGADVHDQVIKYFKPLSDDITAEFFVADETHIDYDAFNQKVEAYLLEKDTNFVTSEMALANHLSAESISESIAAKAKEQYEEKLKRGKEAGILVDKAERDILLSTVDRNWVNHIDNMDALRKGIGLRGYAQRDPVIEYRREGTQLFDEMISRVQRNTARWLAKWNIDDVINKINLQEMERQRHITQTRLIKKVNPNDPCPCGSGKKYKHCCGK